MSSYNIQDNLPHVRVGLDAEIDLLHFSDILDFEGTGTLGNRNSPFQQQFAHDFFLISVSADKILYIKMYCVRTKQI
jgi:hypothetical protein